MQEADFIRKNEYYYRDSVIFSVFNNMYILFDAIDHSPDATYKEMKSRLKISGGALHLRLKDTKIMKLYTNGHGKKLTDLGKRWLNESLKNKGLPYKETIKEACLNVPLFKSLYNEDKELVSANKIFEYFKSYDPEDQINGKFLNMAVKRYLEGIHGITTQRRPRLKLYKRQGSLDDFKAVATIITQTTSASFKIEDYIVLQKQLKELKEKYGKDNIHKILEIL